MKQNTGKSIGTANSSSIGKYKVGILKEIQKKKQNSKSNKDKGK